MTTRIVLIVSVALAILSAALVCRVPVALAQATATYTATATRTPYPFPTATPGATPTPAPTASYAMSDTLLLFSMADLDPSPRIQKELQGSVDSVNEVGKAIDLSLISIDTRTNNYVLRIRGHSPIPLMRGALVLFGDFEWLGILGVWFIIAFIVIAAVAALRTIIAFWGVVERIINLIKLIPFI